MHQKRKLIILSVSVLVIFMLYLFRSDLKLLFSNSFRTDNETDIELYVIKEQGLTGLKKQLVNEGVLKSGFYFDRIAYLKGFTSEKIATGKYIVHPHTSIRNLINGFTQNAQGNGNAEVEVPVSFDNCMTIGDMCGKIGGSLHLDSADFEKYIYAPAMLQKYGFTKEQMPALFLANTYDFFWDTSPEQFVDRMAKEYDKFWNNVRKTKMKKLGFTSTSQVVTLASIVYTEQSVVKREWPIIARLYLNRLKKGMFLQSDPTFKFCWGDRLKGVQILNYQQRNIDCPYNTYKHAGLPPGPIWIVPAGVIDAVLNPDDNNYLFMIAKPDFSSTHNFSVSYAIHEQNAKRYQKWIREQQNK